MRLELALIVTLGLPAVAAAQTAAPVTGGVVPLPPVGLPLPRIGLPLPPIGLPGAVVPPQRRGANLPVTGTRRQHRSGIYILPAYGWPYLPEAPAATAGAPRDSPAATSQPPPLAGRLRLDVEPRGSQQLYIDGYFVGTPEDFGGEVDLEAGPHAVEIQAPGYETFQVNVNISPGRSITYRGTLKAADAKPAPDAAGPNSTAVAPATPTAPAPATPTAVAPATPMTGYVIPGCYVGNVPPQEVSLPASCDLGRLITIKR